MLAFAPSLSLDRRWRWPPSALRCRMLLLEPGSSPTGSGPPTLGDDFSASRQRRRTSDQGPDRRAHQTPASADAGPFDAGRRHRSHRRGAAGEPSRPTAGAICPALPPTDCVVTDVARRRSRRRSTTRRCHVIGLPERDASPPAETGPSPARSSCGASRLNGPAGARRWAASTRVLDLDLDEDVRGSRSEPLVVQNGRASSRALGSWVRRRHARALRRGESRTTSWFEAATPIRSGPAAAGSLAVDGADRIRPRQSSVRGNTADLNAARRDDPCARDRGRDRRLQRPLRAGPARGRRLQSHRRQRRHRLGGAATARVRVDGGAASRSSQWRAGRSTEVRVERQRR